jgi:DICT domain-containing protein
VKTFSLFERAKEFSKTAKSPDLGRISNISRRIFDERETFTFSSNASSIEYACLLIENAILLKTNRAGRVYAGFERFSCLKPVIDRYLRIADLSESLFIFGENDWKPPRHPNVRVIVLAPEFALARESFLIVDSPALSVSLVARDEDGFEGISPEMRNFSAVKSGDSDAVRKLANAAEGVIDWSIAA